MAKIYEVIVEGFVGFPRWSKTLIVATIICLIVALILLSLALNNNPCRAIGVGINGNSVSIHIKYTLAQYNLIIRANNEKSTDHYIYYSDAGNNSQITVNFDYPVKTVRIGMQGPLGFNHGIMWCSEQNANP